MRLEPIEREDSVWNMLNVASDWWNQHGRDEPDFVVKFLMPFPDDFWAGEIREVAQPIGKVQRDRLFAAHIHHEAMTGLRIEYDRVVYFISDHGTWRVIG